jgi:hypothetical protein
VTVYLVQQPPATSKGWTPDISKAAEHGQVKVMLTSGDRPAYHPDRCRRLLLDKLARFDPNHDFILWAGGDAWGLFLTGTVLHELGHRSYRFLRYERGVDAQGQRVHGQYYYVPTEVNAGRNSLLTIDKVRSDQDE